MTTIASTPFYNSAARYTGSNGATANPDDSRAGTDGNPVAKNNGGSSWAANEPRATVDGRIAVTTVKFLDKLINFTVLDKIPLKAAHVYEMPDEQYQNIMEGQKNHIEMSKRSLQDQYTERTYPDYSNDPRMKTYATITIGGRVIATIDNQGVVGTASDAMGEIITKLLMAGFPGESYIPGGPSSAQFRAEKLAEFLGGRIVPASTAMTQRQYNAMPPFEGPTLTIDYEGMRNDPQNAEIQKMTEEYAAMEQKRAEYLSRQPFGQ